MIYFFTTSYAKNHHTKPCSKKRKHSKLRLMGPKDNENNTHGGKKRNDQLVFSPKLVFKGVPLLLFGFALIAPSLHFHCCSFFYKIKPFRNDILQIF